MLDLWACCPSSYMPDLTKYVTFEELDEIISGISGSSYDDSEIRSQLSAIQASIVNLADRVTTLEGKVAQKADSSAITEVWDALSECCSGTPTPTPDPDPQPTGDTHPWDGKKFYATYSNGQTLSVDYASTTGHEYLSEHDTHPEGYDATLMTDAWVGEMVYAVTTYSFSGCSSLSSVTLAEGVEELQLNFASGATSLKTLELPSTFYGFGANCFNGMSLDSLTILATSVPTIASQSAQALFENVAAIYVPSASLAAYKTEWSDIQSKIHAIV